MLDYETQLRIDELNRDLAARGTKYRVTHVAGDVLTISSVEPASTALPQTAKERKETPIASGVLDYFPDALAAIARVSFVGNEQHHPGSPLHWDRSKSTDEADALMRHFLERGTLDTDGLRHSAKAAWRALALLQKEIESERKPKVGGDESASLYQHTCGCTDNDRYGCHLHATGLYDRDDPFRIARSGMKL